MSSGMPIDAIVRVSFQSSVNANQATNKALVGKAQGDTGPGPFLKVGTAGYSCSAADDARVGEALAQLGGVLQQYSAELDFAVISLIRRDVPG